MERNELAVLVSRAQTGDNEALNALFNEYYSKVYYFAYKTVKDENIAADVTQDTFVQVIRNIGSLRDPALFASWIRTITYSRCSVYFKNNCELIADEDEDGNSIFDDIAEEKTEFIPDEALDKEEFRKTVMSIIDELPELQRAAVLMYYFDELSVKQIAAIQGVSEGTVKSRLNYARKHIKGSVEDYENKHGINLHAAILPLMLWLFTSDVATIPMDISSVASRVASSTGVGISVEAGSDIATATGRGIVNTVTKHTVQDAAKRSAKHLVKEGAKSSVGAVAKKAGLSLAGKIIAGITAVAVTAGVVIGAVTLVENSEKKEEIETTAVTEHNEHMNENSNRENDTTENVSESDDSGDEVDSVPEASVISDEEKEAQIARYNAYLTNGGYDDIREMTPSFYPNFIHSDISSHLEDYDNDGVYEVYLNILNDYSQEITAFLDIVDDEVVCIKAGCYYKRASENLRICIGSDNTTGENVLVCYEDAEVDNHSSFYKLYIYSMNDYTEITNYSKNIFPHIYSDENQDEVSRVMSETDLYYESDTAFGYYTVDGEYASGEDYNNVSQKYDYSLYTKPEMNAGTYEFPIFTENTGIREGVSADMAVGDRFTFGEYEQDNDTSNGAEKIEWIVLDKKDGKILAISKLGLDKKPYNNDCVTVSWEECTLREWLNDDFYNSAFSDSEKEIITMAGSDNVFLLSINEALKYFPSDEDRKIYVSEYARYRAISGDWWWLSTPYSNESKASYVYADGQIFDFGSYVDNAGVVRPAIWISVE